MPKVNFPAIENQKSEFAPVPEGEYLCEIHDVKETTSSKGHEQWKLQWKILEGEHKGRLLFDDLTFGGGALKKVKIVCHRLGLDVSGEMNLLPEHIYQKRCYIVTYHEEYNGKTQNKIPFDGYAAVDEIDDADIPF